MSWLQCLLEMGIIYCSCGRSMKSTRSPTELDQNNRDITSILGYVIKKNRSRGAKHGASQRQKMYYHAKQMPKKGPTGKARRPSNDTLTMVRLWRIQKVIVWHRVERTPHNVVRHNRRAETHLHRYKSWKISEFETLDSYSKCWRRNSATTESTTRHCSSEKRMQTIATTSTWQEPNKNTETFLAVNK